MTSTYYDTKTETLNSIDKTILVIDCIHEKNATFADIQKRLALPKATLHRILQSLEKYELIEKNPLTDTYRLGLKFIYYGESVKARLSLSELAKEPLEALSEKLGESVTLSVLYQNVSLALLNYKGADSALISNLLPFSPLNCCASGKIFLSTMDDPTLHAYFSGEKPVSKTVNSVITFDEFKRHQKNIMETGLSIDDEEYEYGLYCMSTPLYNHLGQIHATVGITAPKARLFMQDIQEVTADLLDTAEKISDKLIKIKYQCEYK